jgi:transposase-like protein
MNVDLTDPIFHDENKAREHLEAQRWPDGPFCPHCSEVDNICRLQGKSHRPGLFQCNSCLQAFTVMVGSVFESSHIPLTKWVLAFHLMAASKKGMSALQLQRMLGLGSYRSAWFMCHRIREAMKPAKPSPLGGPKKVIEADETFIGGKAKNRAYAKKPPKKEAVFALVERDGESRSFHVANVKAKTLREAIVKTADRKSFLMTDESPSYETVGGEFALHATVNHSQNEYVRADWHTNTVESRFALMKRAVYGTHHSVSQAHLHRYLVEWDYKWNTRKMKDGERAALAVYGAGGKRLTYRNPN